MSVLDAKAVAAAIAEAFPGDTRGRPERLVFEGTWETQELIRSLRRARGSVDSRFVEKHADSLAALTPEGLHAVLPAYLLYSLRHPDSDATEHLIFHLAPNHPDSDCWRHRLDEFSPSQKAAVAQFLRYMTQALEGEHYDAFLDKALAMWTR